MVKEFGADPRVVLIAIQTVFEGFGTNSPDAARKIVKRYGLQGIPVAHSGSKASRSRIMAGYRTRGTPWTVIAGPDGTVKFNAFHIHPRKAKELIEKLKKEGPAPGKRRAAGEKRRAAGERRRAAGEKRRAAREKRRAAREKRRAARVYFFVVSPRTRFFIPAVAASAITSPSFLSTTM